jgi:hypothetical protein
MIWGILATLIPLANLYFMVFKPRGAVEASTPVPGRVEGGYRYRFADPAISEAAQ